MDVRTRIRKEQEKITRIVTAAFPEYYLAGGTALAFHLQHRFSEDLDFFSRAYDPLTAGKIMKHIKSETGSSFYFDSEIPKNKKTAGMKVFFLDLGDGISMKVDFVEDIFKDGIDVLDGILSLKNIYLMKIFAAIGMKAGTSLVGRVVAGGRQSVKDLYDLYTLSKEYEPLPKFFFRHFVSKDALRLENWYLAFDRQETLLELLDLDIKDDPRKVFVYMDEIILQKMAKLKEGLI